MVNPRKKWIVRRSVFYVFGLKKSRNFLSIKPLIRLVPDFLSLIDWIREGSEEINKLEVGKIVIEDTSQNAMEEERKITVLRL